MNDLLDERVAVLRASYITPDMNEVSVADALAAAGLYVCTEAERRVLAACKKARIKEHDSGEVIIWEGSEDIGAAELARREGKP